MAQQATDLPAIEAEIERIRSLGLDALRARWRSMFGAMPPMALTKDLIARMMIYRIEEDAFEACRHRSSSQLLPSLPGEVLSSFRFALPCIVFNSPSVFRR